jgi:Tol biopolymer transport system component
MSSEPSSSSVLEELGKVLASGVFRSAGRPQTLLRFLVEETVAGRSDRLKDYTLGAEALGRGDAFDPRTDPIARVEASRLRSRLELYYATEGSTDSIRITLPRGGYVPVFENRAGSDDGGAPVVERRHEAIAGPAVRHSFLPVAGVLVLSAALILSVWFARRSQETEPRIEMPLALAIETPSTTDPLSLSLSPDGRAIVFVATSEGKAKLWLRAMDSTTSMRALAGTDRASLPFWSPDGRSVGFFADGQLKRMDLESGLVRSLTNALVPAGAAWSRDGTIIFPRVPDGPFYKVSDEGGAATLFTQRLPQQLGHRFPQLLPDQRHFLYFATSSSPETEGIYVGDLRDGNFSKRLVGDADSPAVYSSGHLFFLRKGTLLAHPFDLDRLELSSDSYLVAESVAIGGSAEIPALSVSENGLIAYRTGSSGKRQFVRFNRSGKELGRLGASADLGRVAMSLSPDGRRLATQATVGANTDIYIVDARNRSGPIKLTFNPGPDIVPIWSPDGDTIVYAAGVPGATGFNLYRIDLNGGSSPEKLWISDQPKQPLDWVGETLLFRTNDPETGWDLWAATIDRTSQPFPIVRTKADESDARLSPDQKWIAYQSNESGRLEIYLQPYPGPGQRTRLSLNGGARASWRPDGKELFYLGLDGTLIARRVSLPLSSKDPVEFGEATVLFSTNVNSVQDLSRNYAVDREGTEFLVDTMVDSEVPSITLILNWKPPK